MDEAWQGRQTPELGIVDGDLSMVHVDVWQDIGGWFSDEDAAFVGRYWEACGRGDSVAELGLWQGRSTCCLGQISKSKGLHHFAVDDWRGDDRSSTGDSVMTLGRRMETRLGYDAALRTFGLESTVRTITLGTHDAAKLFSAESLSCVFVDADHHGPSVLGDILYWWRPLQTGCTMVGHDYKRPDGSSCDVTRVVDAFVEHNGLKLETGGLCWAIRKPPGQVLMPDTDGLLEEERKLFLRRHYWSLPVGEG